MSSDSPRLFNTKYNTTAGRNSQARQRMLSNKISAPLPINLPSLKSETGTESPPVVVPTTVAHNWGSPNPAVSPETSQPDVVVSRAWAVPSSSLDAVSDQLDFPTAAEAVKNTEEKHNENLKPPKDLGRLSWDEMVNDDTEEFSVDVIEFEDGARFPLYDVSPSDRFTEDYDRSYPPQMKPTPREEETKPTPYPFDRGSPWGRNRRQSSHDRKPLSVLQKGEQASAVAERAQKRREEQEASFEAARERARQKADTLGAAMGEQREETKTRTAAENEEAWSTHVEDLKKSKVLSKTPVSGASTWTGYANQLHQSTLDERSEKMVSASAAEIASATDPVVIKQAKSAHPHSPTSQSSPSTWDAFVQEETTKEITRSGRASPAWDTFVSDELQKSGSSQESSSSFGGRRKSAASTVNTHRRFDDQWTNRSPRRASSPQLLSKSDQWPHLTSRGQRRPSGETEIDNKRTSRPYRLNQQTSQREDYKPFTKMSQGRPFASHDSSFIEGKRTAHPPRSFIYGKKKRLSNDFAEDDWSEGKKNYQEELIEGEGPVHASELVGDDRSVPAFDYKTRESKGPIAIMKKPEEKKTDSQAANRRKSTEILWWSEQHQPTSNSVFRTERSNVPRWLTARGKNPFWTFADPVLPFQSDYPIPNEYNRPMGRGKGRPAETAYAQNRMPLVTSILQHERSQKRLDTVTNDMTEDAVGTTQTSTDSDAPAYKTKILDMFKNYQSPIFPQAIQKKIGEKPSNLSFMLDKESNGSNNNNNAKHCYKNCTDWRNISKGNEHIPLMVYTFPEAVETKYVGIYLMPAKLLPQYQSQALSSAIPLPRQMMV